MTDKILVRTVTSRSVIAMSSPRPGGNYLWGLIGGILSDQTDIQAALNAKQAVDADLTAIAALTVIGGWAKRTAADTWIISIPTASDVGADASGAAAAAQAAAIAASLPLHGTADTVTGATFTKTLAVDTGNVTIHGNAAGSALTLGATASVSGTNTGDQDLSGLVPTSRTVNGHALSGNVTVIASDVGLGSVENTALSTWAGTSNITTLGTVATGTWHGTAIADTYISSATAWNAKQAAFTILTTFGGLANAAGWLHNDGAGGLVYSTPAVPAGANPSATIGLSAVNGVATTYLRSDGAPALDQSIAPTWTAAHTYSRAVATTSTDGTVLKTSLTAISGAQKWSPRTRYSGSYFNGSAKTTDFIFENQPSATGGALTVSHSDNGGAYSPFMTLLGSGYAGFGTLAPAYRVDVKGLTANDVISSDMGFNINPVLRPPSFTAALAGLGAGSVNTGDHYYYLAYVTALGDTQLTSLGGYDTFGGNLGVLVTTTAGNGQVNVNVTASTDPRVTGIKIVRTIAGALFYASQMVVATISNVTQTYTDNIADGAATYPYTGENKTSKQITSNGSSAIFIGNGSTYVGNGAGSSITTGGSNTFVGAGAGAVASTGNSNVLVGYGAGQNSFNSTASVGVGQWSLHKSTGLYNIAVGHQTLFNATTGDQNVAIGAFAGLGVVTGTSGIFLGNRAGFRETGSNTLIVDNMDRTTEALGRTSALIYGVMSATPANQILALGGGGKVGIGTIAPAEALSVVGKITATSSIIPGGFTVATLPAGANGAMAYSTNARKVGEGAAAGTGSLVVYSNAAWRIPQDQSVAVA